MVLMTDPVPADLARALERAGPELGPFAGRVHVYDEVTSTNDVAARLAEAGAPEGTAVVADRQTAGRGRRGRRWFSPAGAGLYLSAVFRPPDLDWLTLLAAVAAAEALEAAADLGAEIKWPNDLVLRDPTGWRKLAGILAESSSTASEPPFVVLGIGVNVRRAAYPPELASTAVSIEEATGRPVDRGAVLVELLAALARWRALVRREGPGPLLARWRDRAPTSQGASVEIETPSGRCRGMTAGLDADGALLVRIGSRIERIVSGELTWL